MIYQPKHFHRCQTKCTSNCRPSISSRVRWKSTAKCGALVASSISIILKFWIVYRDVASVIRVSIASCHGSPISCLATEWIEAIWPNRNIVWTKVTHSSIWCSFHRTVVQAIICHRIMCTMWCPKSPITSTWHVTQRNRCCANTCDPFGSRPNCTSLRLDARRSYSRIFHRFTCFQEYSWRFARFGGAHMVIMTKRFHCTSSWSVGKSIRVGTFTSLDRFEFWSQVGRQCGN